MTLNRNFRDFLRLLVARGVEFLVVGGYAVGVHGFPRYTGDLDIFVAIDKINAKSLIAVFEDFGFGGIGITAEDFLEEEIVVEIGREPNKIQILTGIDGVAFETAFEKRIEVDFGDLKVPFIGLDDLIDNKKASGRSRDLIDAEELTRIKREQ